jgi:hypothetical protein
MIGQSHTTNLQSKIQNLKFPQKADLNNKNGMKARSCVMRDSHYPSIVPRLFYQESKLLWANHAQFA